jgi:hypothetical protein
MAGGARKKVLRATASQPELRQFRSVPEFAAIVGVGINQAYSAVNSGQVPSVIIGTQRRISDDVIAAMKRGEPVGS